MLDVLRQFESNGESRTPEIPARERRSTRKQSLGFGSFFLHRGITDGEERNQDV